MTAATLSTLAAALLLWPGRRSGPGRLVRVMHPELRAGDPAIGRGRPHPLVPSGLVRRGWVHPVVRATLVAIGVGATVGVALGGVPGLVLGTLSAAGAVVVLRRREPAAARSRRRALAAELPFALALLAVGLRSGLTTPAAMRSVAGVVRGPLGSELGQIGIAIGSGADPRAAWQHLRDDVVLGSVARSAIRAADTGSALAAAFEGAGTEGRAQRQSTAQVAARRAAVLVLAPLGLCFLPAFVCLGIVPIVLGIADTVLP